MCSFFYRIVIHIALVMLGALCKVSVGRRETMQESKTTTKEFIKKVQCNNTKLSHVIQNADRRKHALH